MKKLVYVFVITLLGASCSSDEGSGTKSDNFNRKAMLINWADNIIIPAYEAYAEKVTTLKTATNTFTETPHETNLQSLRAAWQNAYLSWQSVALFDIGKAETLSLLSFSNIYPADISKIEENLLEEDYNFALSSKNDEQGFPGLDYLINGLAETDAEIVAIYNNETNGYKYTQYLDKVVKRMDHLITEVVTDWTGNGYRDTFINNDGASATSAVNKLINDYIFHYEKILRAGKIGIPAGVFSGTPLPNTVEAYYNASISKALFEASFNATKDFFNGKHYDGTATGESLKSYLDYLNTIKEGEDLSQLINEQFAATEAVCETLNDNFINQITDDNNKMLKAYDELQKNVILMKVDMMQALNIKVDYIDADGD